MHTKEQALPRPIASTLVASLALLLAACGQSTPPGVAEYTTIDFDEVANYSAPELPAYFDESVAALDNSPRPEPNDDRVATLGRVLFWDMRLSTNNKASCATCHQQDIGFTDWIRFSNGISNAATTDFHAMRLGNARYWQPGTMFWDRRAASIEVQASQPLHSLVELGWGGAAGDMNTLTAKMEGLPYYPELFAWAFGDPAISEPRMQQALAQFIRAMVAHSSRWDEAYVQVFDPEAPDRGLDKDLPNFTAQENRGRHLFTASVSEGGAGCASCHVPPTFTLAANSASNGLDAGEERVFKAPSLRNVGLSGPYMHDGRFETLAQVIDHYDHGVADGPALDGRLKADGKPQRLNLSVADREALVAFLLTLNDDVLTADPRFGDPFRREQQF